MSVFRIKIEVEGVPKAAMRLKLFEKDARNTLERGMREATLNVQTLAKNLITAKRHVVTGNLRRSISARHGWVGGMGAMSFELNGWVFTDVVYAGKIEYLPDGGYLGASLEALKPEIKIIMDGAMRKAVMTTKGGN